MSCYDFQKWNILTMLAILTVCSLVGMVNLVFAQTPMDEANKIIEALGNATANETGEVMTQAEDVVNLTSGAASNATQTAMDNTFIIASDASSNATSDDMREANEIISAASNPTFPDDPNTSWNETANPDRVIAEYQEEQRMKTQLESILNNCYEHSDRPNPVQDLIDKGFLSEEIWKGETCKSVKQMYDMTR